MEIEIKLTPTECVQCGIPFAIPAPYQRSLTETGRSFYCPNGHNLTFGEGENKRLIQYISRKNKEIESLEKANSNRKGQITKLEKKLSKEKK